LNPHSGIPFAFVQIESIHLNILQFLLGPGWKTVFRDQDEETRKGSGELVFNSFKQNDELVSYLSRMPKIDSHTHLGRYYSGKPLYRLLESLNMKWLSVCWGGTRWPELRQQIDTARKMHAEFPDRVAWATSFNLDNWENPDWESETIETIEEGFESGSIGVKVWKDIGMCLKNPDGSYVMIDDYRFDPVFDYIEKKEKTLIAHIGEPKSCWLPMDSIKIAGDLEYYSTHPEEHCYGKSEIPSYLKLVKSMDRVLEKHPRLRVVRCHLASLESDVDKLAERFARYPNFSVDLAARIEHLQVQDQEKLRNFLIRFQDRILYATDIDLDTANQAAREKKLRKAQDIYISDLIYFATDWEMKVSDGETAICGLNLPSGVLEKLFYTNALNWYQGI